MVDSEQLFFKSILGADFTVRPRAGSLCSFVICEDANTITLSLDTLKDQRFAENRNVLSGPKIRFYAGLPVTLDGVNIGTFCIADLKPKMSFSLNEIEMLREMAGMISDLLTERQKRIVTTSVESAKFVVSLLHGLKPALISAIEDRDKMILLAKQTTPSSKSNSFSFVGAVQNFHESILHLSTEIEGSLSLGLVSLRLHIDMVNSGSSGGSSNCNADQCNSNSSQFIRQDTDSSSQRLHLEDWVQMIQKAIILPRDWNTNNLIHKLTWHVSHTTTNIHNSGNNRNSFNHTALIHSTRTLPTSNLVSTRSYPQESDMNDEDYLIENVNTEVIALIITWLLRKSLSKWSQFDVYIDINKPTTIDAGSYHSTANGRLLITIVTSKPFYCKNKSTDSDLVKDCDLFVLQFVMQALRGEISHTTMNDNSNMELFQEKFIISIPSKIILSTTLLTIQNNDHENISNGHNIVDEVAHEHKRIRR